MQTFQFYAANLFSLDCEKSAYLYSKLFSLSISYSSKNHAELLSESGFSIFLNKPSKSCNVSPGSISFLVSESQFKNINLEPLILETVHLENRYASYLDEYSNRIWVFVKDESKK